MSTTIRTDNDNAPVDFETVTNKIVTVQGQIVSTTIRTDAGQEPVEYTMVIHTSRKECQ